MSYIEFKCVEWWAMLVNTLCHTVSTERRNIHPNQRLTNKPRSHEILHSLTHTGRHPNLLDGPDNSGRKGRITFETKIKNWWPGREEKWNVCQGKSFYERSWINIWWRGSFALNFSFAIIRTISAINHRPCSLVLRNSFLLQLCSMKSLIMSIVKN